MQAFGPLSARFRDAGESRAPDAELAWYAARLPATGLVLDVMCGTGRLLVPMAERGAKMHGVDMSAAMLARCDEKLAEANLTAPTFRQDVAQMNVPFRYGLAFIAGGAFQLITDPAAADGALERVRAHLVDPGLLVIDCRVPPAGVQRLGAPLVEVRTVQLGDGTQIALRSETTWWADARLARAEHRYAHRRGAQRLGEEHESVTTTWYAREEIAERVKAAGFRDVAIEDSVAVAEEGDAFAVTARV